MPHALVVFLMSVGDAIAGSVPMWLGYRLFDSRIPGGMHVQMFEQRNRAAASFGGPCIVPRALITAAAIEG
jgi:hypothetical protein